MLILQFLTTEDTFFKNCVLSFLVKSENIIFLTLDDSASCRPVKCCHLSLVRANILMNLQSAEIVKEVFPGFQEWGQAVKLFSPKITYLWNRVILHFSNTGLAFLTNSVMLVF